MNYAILNLINVLFEAFAFLILLEILGSWLLAARVRLPDWGYNILRVVQSITGIVLNPIRRLVPSIGGLDMSPMIALFLLWLLRRLVLGLLVGGL